MAISHAVHYGSEDSSKNLSIARRDLYFEYGNRDDYINHVIGFIKANQPVDYWLQRPQDRLFEWSNYNRLQYMRYRIVDYNDVKIIQ